jgi:ribosomal protein S18 acetylase RimI-like enzyme
MKRTGVVTVRPRTPADDSFILALARPSFSPYSQAPGQSVAAMMSSRAAVTLIAEIGGRPIGFAVVSFLTLQKPYGPWARPVLASLDAIAVHEDARKHGVGKALLAGVERAARNREAVSIHLRTATSNRSAQALFRRAGYQVALEIEGFYRGGQNALAMMKVIAE